MFNGRKRLVMTLSGLALVATVGIVPTSSPAHAQPDIKDVQARVDTLFHQAEVASENYNNARIQLQSLRQQVGSLHADQHRQGKALAAARHQVQDSVVRQYEGQNLSAVDKVLVSNDPTAFLSGLSTVSAYNDLQSQVYDTYASQVKALDIRRDATAKRLSQVASTEQELKTTKATIDSKLADAKGLLSHLQAAQREAIVSRGDDRVPTTVTAAPVSGRAAAAVAYAMAQVGKAYVYGAAGPSAFDCSGLTMQAWARAGVSLPHSSSAQYSTGPHIAAADLQPGDLVFYYSPISHVGMYIGNGLIVNAENPGVGVTVTGLYSLPYVGAVRPG